MALADLTDPEAIRQAASEFDAIGRETFLEKYGFGRAYRYYLVIDGKHYDAKAIMGAAHGVQHPDLGHLSSGDFASSESAVKQHLEALGFEIFDAVSPAPTLQEVLEKTLSLLERRGEVDVAKDVRTAVSKDGPRALKPHLPQGLIAKGRAGIGTTADVPWIGVFDEGQTSAQSGYYLVYLFAADGSAVYLALAHATEDIKGYPNYIKKRTGDLRTAGGPHPDLEIEVDLRSKNQRPRAYEHSCAYAIRYPIGQVPADEVLVEGLTRLEGIRETIQSTGLTLEDEATHLVLKWRGSSEPETVAKHRVVAESKGSVWWGGFGSRPVSKKRMDLLRDQLDKGQTTYAFLYGGGQVWRTKLLDATNDAAAVDEELLPGYYSKDDAAYFFKLSEFEQLEQSYLFANVVLARDPDPERMPGALGNQATPLFVRLRYVPETSPTAEPKPPSAVFTMEWLEEQTNWEASALEELVEAVRDKTPQLVLAGPPGTSKTWLAKHLAAYLTQGEPDAYRTVQFHPSYGYEEFIEGLRPVVDKGAVDFRIVPGIVRQMAEDVQDEDQLRVLIIDEMNRANLPLVFGELMYLFEYRNEPVNLRYTANFELPGNLRFIGTMNTADRSIRAIDIALRRRFDVYELPPDPYVLERYYTRHTNTVPDLVDGFVKLNEELENQLDRHHTIGHSFFMSDDFSHEDLQRAWRHKIGPLIEEYFFDEPDVAAGFSLEAFWSET